MHAALLILPFIMGDREGGPASALAGALRDFYWLYGRLPAKERDFDEWAKATFAKDRDRSSIVSYSWRPRRSGTSGSLLKIEVRVERRQRGKRWTDLSEFEVPRNNPQHAWDVYFGYFGGQVYVPGDTLLNRAHYYADAAYYFLLERRVLMRTDDLLKKPVFEGALGKYRLGTEFRAWYSWSSSEPTLYLESTRAKVKLEYPLFSRYDEDGNPRLVNVTIGRRKE